MKGYVNEDGNCGDYRHDKLSAKINSKWRRLYRLDPWYRKILNAHKESCETCKKLEEKK